MIKENVVKNLHKSAYQLNRVCEIAIPKWVHSGHSERRHDDDELVVCIAVNNHR